MSQYFGNLVNTRNNIINNFVSNESMLNNLNVDKLNRKMFNGNENDIVKGLEFIKTEKEMYDRISLNINIIKERMAQILGVKKEIEDHCDEKPTVQRTHYNYNDDLGDSQDDIYYIYDVSDGELKDSSENITINNKMINLNTQSSQDKQTLSMKRKYNDLTWKYFNLKDRLYRFEKLLSNISDNGKNKFKLSEYDLREYGF